MWSQIRAKITVKIAQLLSCRQRALFLEKNALESEGPHPFYKSTSFFLCKIKRLIRNATYKVITTISRKIT